MPTAAAATPATMGVALKRIPEVSFMASVPLLGALAFRRAGAVEQAGLSSATIGERCERDPTACRPVASAVGSPLVRPSERCHLTAYPMPIP